MFSESRAKRGFTLVELLVVIAIIGVLVALLLPAIQAAREAAQRADCTNRLRQIALAGHNYHDAFTVLPPGALVYTGAEGRLRQGRPEGGTINSGASWLVMLLPYLEQEALHDQFDFSARFPGRYNLRHQSYNGQFMFNPFPAVRCPSDGRTGREGSVTNYVACMGGGCSVRTDGACAPEIPIARWEGGPGRLWFDNGVFIVNRAIRLTDIDDGTSNTYMLGETINMRNPGQSGPHAGPVGDNYPSWAAGIDLRGGQWSSSQTLISASLPINAPAPDPTDSGFYMRIFSSAHPGGCNMALADGSVRFMSETMNLDVHRLLGARDSGEPKHF